MNKPTFSIVVPTFNRAAYLVELLQGLVNQTYKNFEVLICDDGSSDHTKEVVESFQHLIDLKYCYDTNWGGPAKPRNTGIRNAAADWVCFLDSDDLWLPNKLEEVFHALSDDRDVIYHLFSTNYQKQIIGRHQKSPFYNQFEDLLFNGNRIVNSSLVVKKSVLLKIDGFREDKKLIGVEDYDLLLRLAREKADFYLIDKVLGEYRLNDTNISGDFPVQVLKINHLLTQYEHAVPGVGKARVEALVSYLNGSYYLGSKDVPLGKKFLLKSLKKGSLPIKLKSLVKLLKF